MKLLWLGPLHSHAALEQRRAVDQAATKWSRGLIHGLIDIGVDMRGITHCSEQSWPMGDLWPGTNEDFDALVPVIPVRYLNICGLRDQYLKVAYRRKVEAEIVRERVNAVVCYNVLHSYHVEAMKVAHERGICCFPIILDGNDPRIDQWNFLLKQTRYAKGIVFLSDWMAHNYPGNAAVLHMDGGASEWFGDEAKNKIEPNLIVYTGGLDHWRGLDFLVEVVKRLTDSKYRIVICGKCDRNAVQRLFGADLRVRVMGFVSDAELHDICCRAAVFLNTRDPKIAENILNFPSKVPNYLAYGKPIVSTWIESFSPEYHNVLQVVESDEPAAFANIINQVLTWPAEERQRHYFAVKAWFCKNKLWVKQAERLRNWMAGLMT